jgi:hypothetical protein
MKFFRLIPVILLFLSCDILRSSPFEVSTWNPGEGYQPAFKSCSVSLSFSHEPDFLSIERYFSMTEDENRITGSFNWIGNTMTFLPDSPIEENHDYTLSITADAHDIKGISLDTKFEGKFTTRPDFARLNILSIFPEQESIMNDTRGEVKVIFSRNFPLKSCNEFISFTPVISGTWQIETDGKTAVFTPSENWQQIRYAIKIAATFTGINGISMGKDFSSIFTVGEDKIKPFLKGAYRIDDNGIYTELAESTPGLFNENDGWEKNDRICLRFSEPVDTGSLKSYFSAEGGPSLIMETENGFAEEVIFSFEKLPDWESRFFFRIKPGIKDHAENQSPDNHIFRIFANGKYSKPPSLAGIRLPITPGKIQEGEQELTAYSIDDLFADLPIISGEDNFPYSKAIPEWIELYFDCAENARPDLFSIMELFSVNSSNNATAFSARSIRDSDFSILIPQKEWESFQRVEIRGLLTNTINSGIVNFQLNAGLKDSLGNKSEKQFRISLLK